MELGAGDILVAHHGGQRPAIIGGGDQVFGQGRLQLEANARNRRGAVGDAFQQRMALRLLQFVPAHVRNLQRLGIVGRDLHHFAGDPAQPGMTAELHPHRGQQLHADTDAQERRAFLQHFLAQRLDHAGHGVQARHAIGKGAHARQHDALGILRPPAGSAVVTISRLPSAARASAFAALARLPEP